MSEKVAGEAKDTDAAAPAASAPLNICQRVNRVREQVAYLQKDKQVANRYMAVTHDAVTAAVRGALIEHGIIVIPNIQASKMEQSGTFTAKGAIPIWRYEARYQVTFVNADKPEEFINVMVEAHALDEGDKAPGKAISYAVKYAMLKLFSIETGEEEEGRIAQVKPEGGKGKILPDSGMWESLTKERQQAIAKKMMTVRDYMEADEPWNAYTEWLEIKAAGFFESAEEEIAGWRLLPSQHRSTLTALNNAERKKQKELDAKKAEQK